MLEIVRDNKYGFLVLAVMVAITTYVWIKAISASQKRNKYRDAEIQRLKHYNLLKRAYEEIDEHLILNAPLEQLFEGVGVNIQTNLEKQEDMLSAFDELSDGKKNVYTLYYFVEDSATKLRDFFIKNGKPITELVSGALKAVGADDISEIVKREYEMFDEDNEEISIENNLLNELDSEFKKLFDKNKFNSLVSTYIKENKEMFM